MTVRKIKTARDRLHRQCGEGRAIYANDFPDGHVRSTMQWRWPLRQDEIARLAQTPDVIERLGRP